MEGRVWGVGCGGGREGGEGARWWHHRRGGGWRGGSHKGEGHGSAPACCLAAYPALICCVPLRMLCAPQLSTAATPFPPLALLLALHKALLLREPPCPCLPRPPCPTSRTANRSRSIAAGSVAGPCRKRKLRPTTSCRLYPVIRCGGCGGARQACVYVCPVVWHGVLVCVLWGMVWWCVSGGWDGGGACAPSSQSCCSCS